MQVKATHRVSLQLKWLHQAQFAGYYVAEEKGYFREEGLQVDIKPGGPDIDPEKLIAYGTDDFAQAGGVESLLAARDIGLPVVAIGAVFRRSMSSSLRSVVGITKLTDYQIGPSTWYPAYIDYSGVIAQSGLDLEDRRISTMNQ
jgi:NitT/TauT family transport system substrate-binding protein